MKADLVEFARNSNPSREPCAHPGHVKNGSICAVCGEWLPTAVCRERGCGWILAIGEATIGAAVEHHQQNHHSVRVYPE
jgi:hypothetical protein